MPSRIQGLGLDVVELERLGQLYARHGERFVARFCRSEEVRPLSGAARIAHLGGLFAAKEAVLKAFGTGWGQGLGLRQIEVIREPGGRPAVRLHGQAAELARRLGVTSIHLSITHERAYAAAVAILET